MKTILSSITLILAAGSLWANPHRLQPEDVFQITGTVISWYQNALYIDIPAPERIDYRNVPGHNIGISVGAASSGPPYKRPPQGVRILFLQHPDWKSFQPGQKITLLGFPWPEKITIDGTEYLAYRFLRPEERPIIE